MNGISAAEAAENAKRMNELINPSLLDDMIEGEREWPYPRHSNCMSEWNTTVLRYVEPSGKRIVYEIAQLTLLRETTPWWRLKRRLELRNQLLTKIIIGISLGYIVKGEY